MLCVALFKNNKTTTTTKTSPDSSLSFSLSFSSSLQQMHRQKTAIGTQRRSTLRTNTPYFGPRLPSFYNHGKMSVSDTLLQQSKETNPNLNPELNSDLSPELLAQILARAKSLVCMYEHANACVDWTIYMPSTWTTVIAYRSNWWSTFKSKGHFHM